MPNRIFPEASPEAAAPSFASPEMKRRIEAFDWAETKLGALRDWPETLRVATRMVLGSAVPMVMLVGPEGVLVYNDGYAAFAGGRHPAILGMPAVEAFPEIADFNRKVMALGARGETLSLRDQELTLNRNGVAEPAWLDLDYSPVLDAEGRPQAVLVIVNETTSRVRAQKALDRSNEQLGFAFDAAGAAGGWDWNIREDRVRAGERFADLFGVDREEAHRGVPIARFVDGVHRDDRDDLAAAIETALASKGEFRHEYRVVDGQGVVHWVLAVGRVVTGQDGEPLRLPGVVVDITERKKSEGAVVASEAKFRALSDSMPQMVWSTLPDGYHDYYNARWYEFTGVPAGTTDGEGWNGVFHPEDQERAWETWRHSLATGEPYEIEYRLRHHSGEYRWTLGRALPIRASDGAILRWVGTCTDIHSSKRAAAEREVVAQELAHRIKNIFSVLTGIVGLSARSFPESKPFAEQLRQRIFAMGRAHDFVRPHSKASRPRRQQTSLRALAEELLSAFSMGSRDGRLRFEGEDAVVDEAAATPLALLFHELATNAAKYGALASPEGSVTVSGKRDGERYVLVWKEEGGPPLKETPGEGFGTRLIALSVQGQLGGTVHRRWETDGLRLEAELPLAALSRSGRLGLAAEKALN